ncbi:MAG: protein kinase [Acidobacteriota bacterium]
MADPGAANARRFFLICAAVALLTAFVGAAILWFLHRPPEVADPAEASLQRSVSAHHRLQRERLDRLTLVARLLAEESVLVRAVEESDGAAVAAALEPLRSELGFDLALIAGPAGRVLARSDGSTADLGPAARALLEAPAVEEAVTGYWEQTDRLYYAARQPIVRDFERIGFAVAAFAVDDLLALEIQRIGGAQAAYYGRSPVGPELIGASSQRAALGLMGQVGGLGGPGGELGRVLSEGEAYPRVAWTLDGSPWIATLTPLLDAAGESAGALAVASAFEAGGGERPWLPLAVLLGTALVSLALASPAIFGLARTGRAPVARLTESIDIARRGDYEQRIDARRAGSLAPAATALDGLLADLRERRALETVGAAATRPLGSSAAVPPAEAGPAVVLGVELHRAIDGLDAQGTIDGLARDLSRIARGAEARGGVYAGSLGSRALAIFRGDDAADRALALAAELHTALSARQTAFDRSEPPALALVEGKVLAGSAALAGYGGQAVAGLTLRRLDSLLREAEAGDVVLDKKVLQELDERLRERGVEPKTRRGLLSPQPLATLDGPSVRAAAGLDDDGLDGARTASAGAVALGSGDVFAQRFELLTELGRGPLGPVFRARDRELGELVALKLYDPSALDAPAHFERLDSGLQGARKLLGGGVARTYDFGLSDGVAYIARELIYGASFEELLARSDGLPTVACVRILRLLAASLEEVHDDGVVHGRLTASNAFIEASGRVRVTDFGVSVVAGPSVAAPELAAGHPADARTDVWSAAALTYHLLTGRPAPGDLAPEAEEIDAGSLGELLATALSPNPDLRPASGRALREALSR